MRIRYSELQSVIQQYLRQTSTYSDWANSTLYIEFPREGECKAWVTLVLDSAGDLVDATSIAIDIDREGRVLGMEFF